MGDVVAAVRVRHETLDAIRGPFHRSLQLGGGPSDDRLLGVVVDFRAKTAADIGGDHAQLRLGNVQHKRAHQQPDDMRVLARREERVFAGGAVEIADRGARLHRVGHQPVVDKVEFDDPHGLCHRRLDSGGIADMPVITNIARHFGEHQRRAGLQRLGDIGDRRLDGVIDRDEFRRVARLREAVGDDDRDRIADMAHAAARQHRMRRLLHRRTVFRVNLPAAGKAADAVSLQLLAGVDGGDACRLCRGAGVDAGNPGMGVRAAQDIGVELARPVDVVGISALAGEEPIVFTPAYGGADLGHGGYSAAAAAPFMATAPAFIASTML